MCFPGIIERLAYRMKPMKFQAIVLAGVIAAGLTVPAVAQQQQPSPAPGQSQPQGDWMMRRYSDLNLTDQQKSQIQTLMQNYRQAHPRGSTPDPAARKQLHDQINAILTPDQQAKLKADEAQFRAQHQGNATTNAPPAPSATPI
jgi:Spy/CpxP family protein refolding chaperone